MPPCDNPPVYIRDLSTYGFAVTLSSNSFSNCTGTEGFLRKGKYHLLTSPVAESICVSKSAHIYSLEHCGKMMIAGNFLRFSSFRKYRPPMRSCDSLSRPFSKAPCKKTISGYARVLSNDSGYKMRYGND